MKEYRNSTFLESAIVSWLKDRVEETQKDGVIFGLSGGIDSAVVAGLARKAFGGKALGVIMPCHSIPEDAEHARLIAQSLKLTTAEVELSQVYDTLECSFPEDFQVTSTLALANMKPRLRMVVLYALAQEKNLLVCGTGNKIELAIGYSTKYGDAGVDLLPLGDLLKGEIRELAYHLDLPEEIITKPPSAGLWHGQTDEKEMGVTYKELDAFFLERKVSPEVQNFIEASGKRSEHKRKQPPLCIIKSGKDFQ